MIKEVWLIISETISINGDKEVCVERVYNTEKEAHEALTEVFNEEIKFRNFTQQNILKINREDYMIYTDDKYIVFYLDNTDYYD